MERKDPSNVEPPCGTCEGLPRVLLSSCRGPRLHWSNPHFGQEGVMLVLGACRAGGQRGTAHPCSHKRLMTRQGIHTNWSVDRAAAISSGPPLF